MFDVLVVMGRYRWCFKTIKTYVGCNGKSKCSISIFELAYCEWWKICG